MHWWWATAWQIGPWRWSSHTKGTCSVVFKLLHKPLGFARSQRQFRRIGLDVGFLFLRARMALVEQANYARVQEKGPRRYSLEGPLLPESAQAGCCQNLASCVHSAHGSGAVGQRCSSRSGQLQRSTARTNRSRAAGEVICLHLQGTRLEEAEADSIRRTGKEPHLFPKRRAAPTEEGDMADWHSTALIRNVIVTLHAHNRSMDKRSCTTASHLTCPNDRVDDQMVQIPLQFKNPRLHKVATSQLPFQSVLVRPRVDKISPVPVVQ